MSTKKRRRPRRHTFYFGVPGQRGSVSVKARVKHAKREVIIERTQEDVEAGKPGLAAQCADAICARRHSGLFPHPVIWASVTRSRAYLIDDVKNGLPVSCVMYQHDDDTIADFDRPGGKKDLLDSGLATRSIRLYPPQKRTDTASAPKGKTTRERSDVKSSKGAKKRAIEAGLNLGELSG